MIVPAEPRRWRGSTFAVPDASVIRAERHVQLLERDESVEPVEAGAGCGEICGGADSSADLGGHARQSRRVEAGQYELECRATVFERRASTFERERGQLREDFERNTAGCLERGGAPARVELLDFGCAACHAGAQRDVGEARLQCRRQHQAVLEGEREVRLERFERAANRPGQCHGTVAGDVRVGREVLRQRRQRAMQVDADLSRLRSIREWEVATDRQQGIRTFDAERVDDEAFVGIVNGRGAPHREWPAIPRAGKRFDPEGCLSSCRRLQRARRVDRRPKPALQSGKLLAPRSQPSRKRERRQIQIAGAHRDRRRPRRVETDVRACVEGELVRHQRYCRGPVLCDAVDHESTESRVVDRDRVDVQIDTALRSVETAGTARDQTRHVGPDSLTIRHHETQQLQRL
jgi:hypothetical protein